MKTSIVSLILRNVIYSLVFVCVGALSLCQQFYSNVQTIFCLTVSNQYFMYAADKQICFRKEIFKSICFEWSQQTTKTSTKTQDAKS